MIGKAAVYVNRWPVTWKPFRGSSELEAIGLLLFGRTAGHGELLLERFALKNFTIGLAKEFVFLCANVFS